MANYPETARKDKQLLESEGIQLFQQLIFYLSLPGGLAFKKGSQRQVFKQSDVMDKKSFL